MAKAKRRCSPRLLAKPKAPPVEVKKRAATKKGPKAKKTKAENGNAKAEQPKADAAESK